MVAPLVSRSTRSVRAVLLCRFCGNGIFTPAIILMTIRTCSRSAACAEQRPITSAVASEKVLIVRDIERSFLDERGTPTDAMPRLRSRMGEPQPQQIDLLRVPICGRCRPDAPQKTAGRVPAASPCRVTAGCLARVRRRHDFPARKQRLDQLDFRNPTCN